MTACIKHRLQWTTAVVHAEGYGTILVTGYPRDQRALHPGITQVVGDRVAATVERLPGALMPSLPYPA